MKNEKTENLVIENKGNQMILKLNRKGFDESYLISLVKRLQVENLARKFKFKAEILTIAEQINKDWWDSNSDEFLKEVNQNSCQ